MILPASETTGNSNGNRLLFSTHYALNTSCAVCHGDLPPTLSRHSHPHFQDDEMESYGIDVKLMTTEPEIKSFHAWFPSLDFSRGTW